MVKKYKIIGVILVLAAITAVTGWYLHHTNIPVLEPRGPIALKERNLLIVLALMSLIVVIPVFSLLFIFAWKYREANTEATYSPELDHSRTAETVWWLIPSILIGIVAVITWNSSHALDPSRPLSSSTPPLTIQVVALDWKWLFIYPQQHIATVNYIKFPVGTPINFEITADAPMNSFWIPQLGGQIYAMPGMLTQLHLLASQPGNYAGSSANISGSGFAAMRFTAAASSQTAFEQWVNTAKQSPQVLDQSSYNGLVKPSTANPASYYTLGDSTLYAKIVYKYMPLGEVQ